MEESSVNHTMNIVMVRPAGGYSGAETYNVSLAKSIKTYFPECRLSYITNNSQFIGILKKENISVYSFPLLIKEIGTKHDLLSALWKIPYYSFSWISKIKQIKKTRQFSIVCLQSMTEKLLLTPWLCLSGYTVIWLEHGPLFITSRTNIVKKWYRLFSSFPKKIIAVSNDTKHDLFLGGITENKIEVVSGGVDTNYFSPYIIKHNNNIIGFLGTITKEKGIKEFISVADLVVKSNDSCTFLVVGNGPDIEWARSEVKRIKLEKYFTFTGFQKDIRQYLSKMDIFFFPTNHQEGISISLLEAASMGLLILSHDIGGNSEIILNNKTGILYKQFNKRIIAKILLDMINNPKKYEKIRKNARAFIVNHYDAKKIAEKFIKVSRSL